MKLKVTTAKGKHVFYRAGFMFTSNPIEVDVSEEVAHMLLGEAMLSASLIVEPISKDVEREEIKKFIPINKKKK